MRVGSEGLRFLSEFGVAAVMVNHAFNIGRRVEVEDDSGSKLTVVVKQVWGNSEETRGKLVGVSGFKTVEEWEQAVKKRNGGRLPRFIVVVEVVGSGSC